MSEWKVIDDDAKRIIREYDDAKYGRYILGYPAVGGGVSRLRWWQSNSNGPDDWRDRYRNFLGDDGNAYHPTHYREMPEPPK